MEETPTNTGRKHLSYTEPENNIAVDCLALTSSRVLTQGVSTKYADVAEAFGLDDTDAVNSVSKVLSKGDRFQQILAKHVALDVVAQRHGELVASDDEKVALGAVKLGYQAHKVLDRGDEGVASFAAFFAPGSRLSIEADASEENEE